ncbi:MAG TPA: FG-GAP-like repeat-containing protein [Edaphocola sp.]|nr:FG-GAP-like repeat-containing protein [Edaphocola sp.]
MEGFSQIIANGSYGNGPISFTVINQNGWTLTYGGNANSRIGSTNGIISWFLTEVTDQNGNKMTYTYNNNGSDIPTIATISYNQNTTQSLGALTSITFTYTTRTDKNFSYIFGKKMAQTKLLSSIEIKQAPNGLPISITKYLFEYQVDASSQKTHLIKIRQLGFNNQEELGSTQLAYHNDTLPVKGISNAQPEINFISVVDSVYEYSFCVGDFNGDGVSDVLTYNRASAYHDFQLYLKNPNGAFNFTGSGVLSNDPNFNSETKLLGWQQRAGNTFDFNGDGKDDLFYFQQKGYGNNQYCSSANRIARKFYIDISNGTTITPISKPIIYLQNSTFETDIESLIGDFDGDGKTEVMLIPIIPGCSYPNNIALTMYMLGGKYFSDYYYNGTSYYKPKTLVSTNVPNLPFYFKEDEARAFTIDYNGDGKTDILFVNGATAQVFELNVSFDNNGNPVLGNPVFKLINSTGYPTQWHTTILTGDFNGDGITDLLTWNGNVWEIGYGKGNGLMNDILPAPSGMALPVCGLFTNPIRPIVLGDYNGDGLTDIFDYSDSNSNSCFILDYNPRIWYSKGNNAFNLETDVVSDSFFNSTMGNYNWIGDFNGDGKLDMLTKKSNLSPDLPYIHSFHPNEHRDYIAKISNGLGAFTKINYASIANDGIVYQPGTLSNTYPIVRKTLPFRVVSSILTDNGIDSIGNTISYQYKGLKYAYWGRGILGFDQVTINNVVNAAITEKTYSLNASYFIPHLINIKNKVNNVLISETNNTYNVKDFGAKRIFPYLYLSETNDAITNQNSRTTYNYNIASVPGGSTGFDIGKPIEIITLKGFRDYIPQGGFFPQTNQLEKTIQTFTYPNIIGNTSLPYFGRFVPTEIKTSVSRSGDADYIRLKSFTYNYNKGWLVSSIDDPYSGNNAVTTTYTYNGYGNKMSESISATGLPTITTNYVYHTIDPRLLQKSYNSNYPNIFTSYGYQPWTGDLINQTAPDGLVTNINYDAFGRVTSKSNNNGMSSTVLLQWDNSIPNAKYKIITDDNVSEPSVSYFDRLGRNIRETEINFNGETKIVNTAFNNKGQLTSRSLPYFSNNSPTYFSSNSYDVYGRQTAITTPNGTTSYQYNTVNVGQTGSGLNLNSYSVKITDPTGYEKTSTTDASGAVTSTIDNGGSLTYNYGSKGLKEVKLSGTVVQSVQYDDFGRKVSETDPNYGSYQYEYDAYNQLKKQTDPSGQEYQFAYNNLGLVTTKTGPEGVYTHTYSFSAGPNVLKMISLSGPQGTINYTYGKGDQMLSESRISGSNTFTNSYTFNGLGQVASRTYPDGSTVNYTYNANDGSCSNIGIAGETISTNNGQQAAYIYSVNEKNVFGQVTKSGFGSFYSMSTGLTPSISDFKSYTSLGLLNAQSTAKMTSQGPLPQMRTFTYSFQNSTGHLLNRRDNIHILNENFSYDNLKRLETVTGIPSTIPSLVMNYDANGNITQKSDAGEFQYDNANKVTEINPFINIPIESQTLTYTPFKKVETINENGVAATFTYWPDGERASMTITGSPHDRTVYYAPDYEKTEIDGIVKEYSYITNENGFITTILGKEDGSSIRYYVLTDYLGSITHIMNHNGNVIEEKNYDAWGRYRNPDDWQPYDPTFADMQFYRGYTGHEYIPEFGIINMNGRLYDPLVGRMFSPDPYIMGSDNTQGYNRYTYALNNPFTYTDPSGEFVWMPIIVGAAIGAYLGGATANNNFNPIKWDWNSSATWKGIGVGAIAGGLSGAGWSVGLAALGKTGFWATAGKAVLAGKLINTATTATSLISNFENGARIFAGRYYTDENRTFAGQLFQGISRYTWEGLQTWVGYNFTQIRNTFGKDGQTFFLGGATILNKESGSGEWWGVTMGNYINTQDAISGFNKPIGWENPLIQHEYGHTLQSRIFGFGYFFPIMPWSGFSAWLFTSTHEKRWFERGADRYSRIYRLNKGL